jgi:hypothetical protein
MRASNTTWPATLVVGLLACGSALAAGGHHAVDDARIMGRGDCEQESWFSRARGGEKLLHAGGSCRVGPVELGVAAEYARAEGSSETGWELEAKWARRVVGDLSLGLLVQPDWQAHVRPRYQGAALVGLATWRASDAIALHLNLGREFVHQARDGKRGGLALEWEPIAAWSFVGERYREGGSHYLRAGARWAAGRTWTVDLSHARRLAGPGTSFWTLGLSFDLDDD